MSDILVPKKNIILDATTLSSMMSCARYYDLRFNNRFSSAKGKSNSLEMGLLAHKILEVYGRHILQGFKRVDAIGQAMVAGQMFVTGCPYCADGTDTSPSCKHEPGEYPGVQNSPELSEGYKTGWKFVLNTMEQYFEFYKNDAHIILGVETVKGEVLYEDEDLRVLWKAKFDRIVDTNQIGIVSMDHKTFKQRRDQNTLSSQFMGQCILLKARNVIVDKIGFQSSLKIADRLSREIVSYSMDRLDEWRYEILPYYAYKYIEYQESGYYPPDFTHCDTMFGPCMFKPVCQSDRGMREEVLRNEFQLIPVWDPTNKSEDE